MSDLFFGIDPGIAETGYAFLCEETHERATIRANKQESYPARRRHIAHKIATKVGYAIEKKIKNKAMLDTIYVHVAIEDYVIRSLGKSKQAETIKLIGCLEYVLDALLTSLQDEITSTITLLKPGATGWQSSVKKKFNQLQKIKGRGWNSHTRDALCMCYYLQKRENSYKKKEEKCI